MRRSHCKHRIVMPQSATPLLSAVFTPRRRTEPGPMGTHCFPFRLLPSDDSLRHGVAYIYPAWNAGLRQRDAGRLLHASPRRFPDLNRGPFRGIPYISVIFAGFPPAPTLYTRRPVAPRTESNREHPPSERGHICRISTGSPLELCPDAVRNGTAVVREKGG